MANDHPPAWGGLPILAVQRVTLAPGIDQIETFTADGLLTVIWHGDPAARRVVLASGGAMGGTLGPGRGIYPAMASELADDDIAVIRVGYRRPNELDECVADVLVAAQLSQDHGGTDFITVGHSFGGPVALQAAHALGSAARGAITLATQAAGAEQAEGLAVPVLLLHGDRDQILPPMASQLVQMVVGGELVVLAGADHLMGDAHDELVERVSAFIRTCFGTQA